MIYRRLRLELTITTMTTSCKIIGTLLVLMAAIIEINSFPSESQNYTCTVSGQSYQIGETIGDPCDGCVCTKYNVLCQLRYCPPVQCADNVKPAGECCHVCPTGPNCEYTGSRGLSLVPVDSGCRYSDNLVCFCYESLTHGRKLMPYCLPPFPGDTTEPCSFVNRTEVA